MMIAASLLGLALQTAQVPSPARATFAPCPTPRPQFFTVLTEGTSKPVDVPASKQFVVALKSNPSTGYRWALTAPPSGGFVRSDGSQFVSDNAYNTPPPSRPGQVPAPLMVGVGGTELWLFSALQPGTSTLSFALYPPGRDTRPNRTVWFSVRVVPDTMVC
jgi:predicted secreted protein